MKQRSDSEQITDEIEGTFWHQFFIRLMFACVAGFVTTLVLLPLMTSLYAYVEGKAKQPPPVKMIVSPLNGCMEGKPAKVVKRDLGSYMFSTNNSVITLQRGDSPTFICKFATARLYNSWSIGDTVYHAGGERL